jgi:hypothetical protein
MTVGPILLGAAKPVHILTPSATVRRIINMTALTVVEATAAQALRPRRSRLGDRARELRRRVFGRRRPRAPGPPDRGRHRRVDDDPRGVERIMRFAFKLAQSRPRKLLTVITKSNAQRHAW